MSLRTTSAETPRTSMYRRSVGMLCLHDLEDPVGQRIVL